MLKGYSYLTFMTYSHKCRFPITDSHQLLTHRPTFIRHSWHMLWIHFQDGNTRLIWHHLKQQLETQHYYEELTVQLHTITFYQYPSACDLPFNYTFLLTSWHCSCHKQPCFHYHRGVNRSLLPLGSTQSYSAAVAVLMICLHGF